MFCGDGVVKDFVGKFSEYRAWIKDVEAEKRKAEQAAAPKPGAQSAQTAAAPKTGRNSSGGPRRLSYKERKELESIEAAMPLLEQEKAGLEAEMSSGDMAYDALQKAGARIEEILAELDRLETRWLELSE